MVEKSGDVRTGFEEVKEEGIASMEQIPDLNINNEMKNDLFKIIDENVVIHKVSITAEYDIRTSAGNGINLIKESLIEAKKLRRPKGVDVKFFYMGAPIYRSEIEASDYPTAENFQIKLPKKLNRF